MPRVVITGGPGAGKTTLLAELARRGFATVPESARAIIAERLAQGLPPRPEPLAFAQEILRRDLQKHDAHDPEPDWTFYDRSALEAVGMLHDASPMSGADRAALLSRCSFHRTVFLLPPWEAIYATDAERDHPFAHAVRVHAALAAWYPACGYDLHELPCLPVPERADHLLQALGAASGASR
jgi:predicted ATPase